MNATSSTLNEKYDDESTAYFLHLMYCASFPAQPKTYWSLLIIIPFLCAFAIFTNGLILVTFIVARHRLLETHAHHIYVLASAVVNLATTLGATVPHWFDILVIPCDYFGITFCYLKSTMIFCTAYQSLFIVCLLCRNRYHMVKGGAMYVNDERSECRAARRWLPALSVVALAAFVVPEVWTPHVTHVSQLEETGHCSADQDQESSTVVFHPGHIVGGIVLCGSWLTVILYSLMCLWALLNRRAMLIKPVGDVGNATPTNATAAAKSLIRPTFVSLCTVLLLLLTFGPRAVEFFIDNVLPGGEHRGHLLSAGGNRLMEFNALTIYPGVCPVLFYLTLPDLRREMNSMMSRCIQSL